MQLNKIYQPIGLEMSGLKESMEREFNAVAMSLQLKNKDILTYQGKNLRSAMFFLSYNIAAQVKNYTSFISREIINIATAIELMHSASLYHDDVIDNARIRRNKKSANIMYGNSGAVLLGDSLFAKAFHILSQTGNSKIIEALSMTAKEMSIGEINHTFNYRYPECENMPESEYYRVIEQKTASFFSCCCRCGVLAGNAESAVLEKLSDFGLKLGIAYQIIDDCIDLIGDEKKAGKTLKSDSTSGKFTLPLIFMQQEILNNNKSDRKKYPSLLDIWEEHSEVHPIAIKKTLEKIRQYIEESMLVVSNLPQSDYSKALMGVADYVNDGITAQLHQEVKQ